MLEAWEEHIPACIPTGTLAWQQAIALAKFTVDEPGSRGYVTEEETSAIA